MAKLSNDINSEIQASQNHENKFPDQLPQEQLTEFWKPKARLSVPESSEPVKPGRSSQYLDLSKNQLSEPDSTKVKLIRQERQPKVLSSSGFMALKKNTYRKQRNYYEPAPDDMSQSRLNKSRPSVNVELDELHTEETLPRRRPKPEPLPEHRPKRIPSSEPRPRRKPVSEPELKPSQKPIPEPELRQPIPEPELRRPIPEPELRHKPIPEPELRPSQIPIPEPELKYKPVPEPEPNRKPIPKRKPKPVPEPEQTPQSKRKRKPKPESNLNQDNKPKPNRKTKQKLKPKRTPIRVIANILFYMLLLFIMVSLVLGFHNTVRPIFIYGHTIQNVATDCMDDIPQNSLIIVQRVDPTELVVGDAITFYIDEQTVLTQRITELHDDAHVLIGVMAFGTSGLGTTHDILVPDANVIGRVIFYYPDLGPLLEGIPNMILNPDYFLPVIGAYVGIMVLLFILRGLFSKGKIKKARKKTVSKEKSQAQMS